MGRAGRELGAERRLEGTSGARPSVSNERVSPNIAFPLTHFGHTSLGKHAFLGARTAISFNHITIFFVLC